MRDFLDLRWIALLFVACLTGVDAAPLAYVSNEGSSSISVIDTATDKVVSTLKFGQKPRGIALSHDGKRLFVSDQTANALRVIDLEKNAGGRAHRRSATRPKRSTFRPTASGCPRRSRRTIRSC